MKILGYIIIFWIVLGSAFYLWILTDLHTLINNINTWFWELMPTEWKAFVTLLIFAFVIILGLSFT